MLRVKDVDLVRGQGFSGDEAVTRSDGREDRHQLNEAVVQRAVTRATRATQRLNKRVMRHPFRHSFANPLLERGHDI